MAQAEEVLATAHHPAACEMSRVHSCYRPGCRRSLPTRRRSLLNAIQA